MPTFFPIPGEVLWHLLVHLNNNCNMAMNNITNTVALIYSMYFLFLHSFGLQYSLSLWHWQGNGRKWVALTHLSYFLTICLQILLDWFLCRWSFLAFLLLWGFKAQFIFLKSWDSGAEFCWKYKWQQNHGIFEATEEITYFIENWKFVFS